MRTRTWQSRRLSKARRGFSLVAQGFGLPTARINYRVLLAGRVNDHDFNTGLGVRPSGAGEERGWEGEGGGGWDLVTMAVSPACLPSSP